MASSDLYSKLPKRGLNNHASAKYLDGKDEAKVCVTERSGEEEKEKKNKSKKELLDSEEQSVDSKVHYVSHITELELV